MLVGRDRERELLRTVLADAIAGNGRAIAVLGEPGIGKTALLEAVSSEARGVRLVRARGLETESAIPFAGLSDALSPLVDGLAELPDAQAIALRSALALGESRTVERFALCAATLGLLSWAAEREPLLVVVDDAHWLDPSSLEALLFTARRLASERVAFVLASRVDGHWFDGLERLELGGLATPAAVTLLEGADVSEHVGRRLVAATAGNPLALLELPRLLTAGQRGGTEPLDDPLPVAPALETAFLKRTERLSAEARRALVIAAAEGEGAADALVAALEADGLGLETLREAEADDLLTLRSGELRFRHPLVRAALYAHASPPEQRRAHALLASTSTTLWRRAWHLAAATLGPDEEVAWELQQAATEARARNAYEASARAWERAAQHSPDTGDRARRLLAAAMDERLAGREPAAVDALDRSLDLDVDPLLRAEIEHLRARIRLGRAPDSADRARLLAAAASVEALDPVRAALMYLDAAFTAVEMEQAEVAEVAVERMRRVLRDRQPALPPELDVLLSGWLDELSPDGVAAYAPRWNALLAMAADLESADRLILVAAGASFVGEQSRETRELLTRVADEARRAGAGWILAQALSELSLLDFRISDWRTATVEAEEALRLSRETDRPLDRLRALTTLVRIEGGQGREQECRRHADEAWRTGAEIGASSLPDWHCNVGLGLLELGLGNPAQAARNLELPAGDVDRGTLVPGVFRAAGDLIEAYFRAGDSAKAGRLLDEFERRAREVDRTWALAVAARCRGLLAADDSFELHFERALELHEQSLVPFERARTELCYGERLRRGRRRRDARRHLVQARDELDRIGATLWARRAERELVASGERLRQRGSAAVDSLTAHELQLARLVATGATNKEAASSLFVSHKTVEAHLGSIYRKLGLRSRTELAAALSTATFTQAR